MSLRVAFVVLLTAGASGCRCDKSGHGETHEPAVVAPFRAALAAPEGKTPCESAHNSLIALEEGAMKANMPAPWPVLPKREEFIDVCQRLSPETQRCLFPRYHSQHHDKCVELIEQMKTDEWGKVILRMINADGSANHPTGATTPAGQSGPVLPTSSAPPPAAPK